MEFKTIQDITNFVEMTMTEQTEMICKTIKQDVKLCGSYYIYDNDNKLWTTINYDGFVSYMFKQCNNMIKQIKQLVNGLHDKRIDALIKNLDKRSHVLDIIDRIKGDLTDLTFSENLNQLHDHLPIKNNLKICLKTGETTERTREDYFTFVCPVSKTDNINNANKFFSQLFPDETNRKYVQKILGYCLTGDMKARNYFVLYGSGCNGKSLTGTLMNLILNKFFVQCADEVFQKTKTTNGPTPHLASLHNKRFGFYSEGSTSDE